MRQGVATEDFCFVAELLDCIDPILYPKNRLIDMSGTVSEDGQEKTDLGISRVALVVKLRQNPALLFRAIAENWLPERVIRELY